MKYEVRDRNPFFCGDSAVPFHKSFNTDADARNALPKLRVDNPDLDLVIACVSPVPHFNLCGGGLNMNAQFKAVEYIARY